MSVVDRVRRAWERMRHVVFGLLRTPTTVTKVVRGHVRTIEGVMQGRNLDSETQAIRSDFLILNLRRF